MIHIVKKFKQFMNEQNSNFNDDFDFKYEIGDIFEYYELPFEIRNDIVNCLIDENDMELKHNPEDLKYKVILKSYDDLIEWLDNVYGVNLVDAQDSKYVISLSESIKKDGLKYPVIFGCEGHHRALAYSLLEKPIPSLEIIF